MNRKDIHIGDVLQVREWDDMLKEFGLYGRDSINAEFVFTPEMKYLCGQIFTVQDINDGKVISVERCEGGWNVSADMLKPYDGECNDSTYENIDVSSFL